MKSISKGNHYSKYIVFAVRRKKKRQLALSFSLYRQLGAAFDATTLQYSTSTFSGDACAKSVSTGAVTGVWLVCSLWHI
jgi:hypothetical protein